MKILINIILQRILLGDGALRNGNVEKFFAIDCIRRYIRKIQSDAARCGYLLWPGSTISAGDTAAFGGDR